jgi:signal transduction histidine kinase
VSLNSGAHAAHAAGAALAPAAVLAAVLPEPPQVQPQAQDIAGALQASLGLGQSLAAVRLDPIGRIAEATLPAAAMLGFEPEDLCGRMLKDLALDGWQAAADVAAARVRYGSTESFELALKGRSGRRTLVEMTARLPRGEDGIVIDWSERRPRRGLAERGGEAERLAGALLEHRETELHELASSLRHDLAPTLVLTRYLVESALKNAEGPLPGEDALHDPARPAHAGLPQPSTVALGQAVQRLREVVGKIERVANALRPTQLDDLGLLASLQDLCRRFGAGGHGPQIELSLEVSEAEIPVALRVTLFRVAETALENSFLHSDARHVQVVLQHVRDELILVVEDDGRGFSPEAALSTGEASPLGLRGLRRRIVETGGRLVLSSSPGHGSRVGGVWVLVRG